MDAQGRRAAAWMDHLSRTTTLTEDGKNWLTAAIDPFHDLDIKVQGLPDMVLAPSVVQCVKQTMQISCPAAITSGTWDCHLYTLPWLTATPMSRVTTFRNTMQTGSLAAGPTMGGLVAASVATGGNSIAADTSVPTQCLALADNYLQGSARVIAAGFEVVNTTSKLHAQGQVIAYRQPQPAPRASTYFYASSAVTSVLGAGTYSEVYCPPQTPAAALKLAGSRQWDAIKGSYNVATFSSLDIPADGDSWSDPIFYFAPPQGTSVANVLIPTPFTGGSAGALFNPSQTAMYPMNTAGAYYTGLSLETTLSVTLNVYVERFPGSLESDLSVLASPSPAYDITAMQLYTHALRDMPPGVVQSANGFGDWFAGVAQKVGGAVSKIAGMFPHPVAQAVSQGAGVVSSVAGSFTAPPNSRAPALVLQKQNKHTKSKQETSVDERQDRLLGRLETKVEQLAKRVQAQHAPPPPPKGKRRR